MGKSYKHYTADNHVDSLQLSIVLGCCFCSCGWLHEDTDFDELMPHGIRPGYGRSMKLGMRTDRNDYIYIVGLNYGKRQSLKPLSCPHWGRLYLCRIHGAQ